MRSVSILALALALFACSGNQRTIRIPDSVVADPKKAKTTQERVAQPYVVKMSDGKRTWQIEIPVNEGSPTFSAAIPLDLGQIAQDPPDMPPTEADREVIEAKRAAGEPIAEPKPGESPKAQSYLATLARVRELYKRRQYELALVDLVNLDRQYPDDERILAMKGTLYRKLGRRDEAKRAWERVLALNPDNAMVGRALEQLLEETE
ncbi:MAG: tetratricopeptide repeat protein [Deltaproteobacteria bacterium]|jgi:tetratricopeptide (TPR) repeat protein